ncbi:MAG TPA: plastocyanin/azurin family copper-binding protein [Solirubrobacteraceae bacterium]|nr:plastocyanin/azurin family copper-binding protein [Solirubrobacteraceae bacterium]
MTPMANLPTSRRARRLLAAAAAASVFAAGCGSDGSEPPAEAARDTPPATSASSPATTLRVTETDFAIKPEDARIDEPGTVRFEVVNRGQAPHSLAIETGDGGVQTPTLGTGETGEVEARLEEGTYTWYCPVGDHRARGMEGELTVGSGSVEQPEEDSAPSTSGARGGYG